MRMMAHLATALALLLPVAPALAQQAAPPIEYEIFTLDNGLTVIVHEDHSTPVVAVNVVYDVGSKHEAEGRSGFAHLFEHMLSQETENLEQGELRRLVAAAGGNRNATTNEDRTAYYEVLPSNRVNLALWLHAERLARLVVNEENWAREREVVKEERRLRYENRPYRMALLTMDTLVADWEPYNHPVIGSMEDLNAATAEDALEFYEQYYVPNNATMAVVGDVTVEQVRELVEEYFSDIPLGTEPAPLPPYPSVPRTDGERRLTLEDKLANTPAYIAGFGLPPHSDEDSYALGLLSRIFSQGESSRLHQRLVKDEEAALLIQSFLDSRVGPGILYFIALPNQGIDIERIEALVNEEVERLQNEGISERELQKAKNQYRAGQIMERQTVFAKGNQLQHYRLLHNDVAEINTELERYMAVTIDDIRGAAREYLVPANRSVIIVVPPAQSDAADAIE